MRSYRSTTAAAEHKVATRFIANEFGHAKVTPRKLTIASRDARKLSIADGLSTRTRWRSRAWSQRKRSHFHRAVSYRCGHASNSTPLCGSYDETI